MRDPPRRLVMDSKKMYEAVFGKVRADPREGTRGINTTAPCLLIFMDLVEGREL